MKVVLDEIINALECVNGTNLVKKFTDDEEFLENEMKNALPRVQFLQLIPEHMTGKLVNES